MARCMANTGMFEAALLRQQATTSASHLHESPPSADPALALTLDLSSQDDNATPTLPRSAPAAASNSHDADVYQLIARYHWLGGCLSEHLKHFEDASQQYQACKAALEALSSLSHAAQAVSFTAASGVSISAALVESRLEALEMIIIVEEGRRCLDEGRNEELVSRLSPVLLSGNTSQLPLSVPQQLAGLDLIKVSMPTRFPQHNDTSAATITLQPLPRAATTSSDQSCTGAVFKMVKLTHVHHNNV